MRISKEQAEKVYGVKLQSSVLVESKNELNPKTVKEALNAYAEIGKATQAIKSGKIDTENQRALRIALEKLQKTKVQIKSDPIKSA